MPRCLNVLSKSINPVDGTDVYYYCSLERESIQGCGKEGRYWEEKEKVA